MSYLPVPIGDAGGSLSPRQLARASRAQAKAELTVFGHALQARAQSEMDRIDSQATSDAFQAALDEEIGLLDYGLARAGGSAVKVELVARKVESLSAINNRRLARRFGGVSRDANDSGGTPGWRTWRQRGRWLGELVRRPAWLG